jgi:hypothetical protein
MPARATTRAVRGRGTKRFWREGAGTAHTKAAGRKGLLQGGLMRMDVHVR